ncbi:hypothetical protein [Chelatococcus reniformis]|uniref:Uncharacterized protein n=1 Tax=Chelatococcus reniformis TaxID=1494448 RepID=A0A916UF45_9HYPH|nr:hypothetical protein [Chelatococcus reniformis]GGC70674.1 hypothetical protein GCM10010994_31530 [Chelatococcus reniformis]
MTDGFRLTYTSKSGGVEDWLVHCDGLEAAKAKVEKEIGEGHELSAYKRVSAAELASASLEFGEVKRMSS